MNPEFSILLQDSFKFDTDAKSKNEFIGSSASDMLIFINSDTATEEEVIDAFNGLKEAGGITDAVVFGSGFDRNPLRQEVLAATDSYIFAIAVSRKIFSFSGSFNERLDGAIPYEFICRLLEYKAVSFVECETQNVKAIEAERIIRTVAYIIARNRNFLSKNGIEEDIIAKWLLHFASLGAKDLFWSVLGLMLHKGKDYTTLYEATSDYFIIGGENICYGVLQRFAGLLGEALSELGEKVTLYSESDDDACREKKITDLFNIPHKAVIGFHTLKLLDDGFNKIECPKYIFWFDNVFFDSIYGIKRRDTFRVISDKYYADYIKKMYDADIFLLPPGQSVSVPDSMPVLEKKYDVIFVASYIPPEYYLKDDNGTIVQLSNKERRYFESFEENANLDFITRIRKLEEISDEVMPSRETIMKYERVYYYTMSYSRKRIVDYILNSGIELHVVGETWKVYEKPDGASLIIHGSADGNEMYNLLTHSKIALNIMREHKGAMTERVTDTMLAGCVCFTDPTVYLKDRFIDNEDIVFYDLNKPDEMCTKLRELISDELLRNKITTNAFIKARSECWYQRARALTDHVRSLDVM